ncbi:hypothetical protein Y1Q_0010816 [Alligator mississippiensis]|uniref:Uncharacterized protein n=1 Tax=Alligator mississippiensis TaxID=8496 RepID=A0A151M6Z8_ALLMI|nr:hypothetical protein Y1Q_0010816 [Alligator mississippiensis]
MSSKNNQHEGDDYIIHSTMRSLSNAVYGGHGKFARGEQWQEIEFKIPPDLVESNFFYSTGVVNVYADI